MNILFYWWFSQIHRMVSLNLKYFSLHFFFVICFSHFNLVFNFEHQVPICSQELYKPWYWMKWKHISIILDFTFFTFFCIFEKKKKRKIEKLRITLKTFQQINHLKYVRSPKFHFYTFKIFKKWINRISIDQTTTLYIYLHFQSILFRFQYSFSFLRNP